MEMALVDMKVQILNDFEEITRGHVSALLLYNYPTFVSVGCKIHFLLQNIYFFNESLNVSEIVRRHHRVAFVLYKFTFSLYVLDLNRYRYLLVKVYT